MTISSTCCSSDDLTSPTPAKRALVLGGDAIGTRAACKLAIQGYEVVILGRSEDSDLGFTNFTEAKLEEIKGFRDNFDVRFVTPQGRHSERVNYIVCAKPAVIEPKFDLYGLKPSKQVISLSDFTAAMKTDLPVAPEDAWFHVAFLCGLKGNSGPENFSRVLDCLESLAGGERIQSYVFTRDLKVAGTGLESRYRNCRENGALFFKFDDQNATFESGDEGISIIFPDPQIKLDLDLTPDLMVVDEDLLAPDALEAIFRSIPSSASFQPYLQPESPRFHAVYTPKAGIFSVGPSRGVFSQDQINTDIESLVPALATQAEVEHPAKVNPEKCAICLTCVRLCPHGAISFAGKAEIDPNSCFKCGICAVECPNGAIDLIQTDPNDLTGVIARALSAANSDKSIVALLCSRSGAQALQTAWSQLPENLVPISAPCAGSIGAEAVLGAFEQGAFGVIIAGCFKGNCASVYGSSLAQERINAVRRELPDLGIDPAKVKFVQIAANTEWVLRSTYEQIMNLSE